MTTMSLPLVSTCSVTGCSYNHDTDCHAGAITITGTSSMCGTFVESPEQSGSDATAQVGACHRSACVHNDMLECHADNVEVGPGADVADCLTFSAA